MKISGLEEITDSIYSNNSIKGLDTNLLKLNREKLAQQKNKTFYKTIKTAKNLSKSEKIQLKIDFKSIIGQKVHQILTKPRKTPSKNRENSSNLFSGGKMLYEFKIQNPFEPIKIHCKEEIPKSILKGEKYYEEENKNFINFGPPELLNRIIESFKLISKGIKIVPKTKQNNKIDKNQFFQNEQIENSSSESEDIFENAGNYQHHSLKNLKYNIKSPIKNSSPKINSKNSLSSKSFNKSSKSPHISESSNYRKISRRSHRSEKSRRHSHRSKRHENKRKYDKNYEKYDKNYKKNDKNSDFDRKHRKRRKNDEIDYEREYKREEKKEKFQSLRTEPMPARDLARQAKKNLAPRGALSIKKRIEQEENDDDILGLSGKIAKIGLNRAFQTAADPYDLNGAVEYGAANNVVDSDDEEAQNKGLNKNLPQKMPRNKYKKLSQKRKYAKNKGNNIAKFERQWKQIKKRLDG